MKQRSRRYDATFHTHGTWSASRTVPHGVATLTADQSANCLSVIADQLRRLGAFLFI